MSDSEINEYRFDDLVVDRANFRVTKAGETRTLTPRAFDVLVYLIRNRDRVVEKQELFEAIWKETFVTDSALMRAIKEIRRGLGDAAGSPRYVETVHKRGYRFIGCLNEAPLFDGTVQEEPGPPVSHIEVGPATEGDRVGIGDRNASRVWMPPAAFGLVIAAVLIGAAVWSVQSNKNPITSIAVLPFVNESGNPELEYLSDGMTEALIGSLSQVPTLKIKARSTVFRFKGKDTPASNVGSELNVQAVLTGRVVQRGDDLTIYLSLVDTANENNLWSKQYDRKFTNLLMLQSEIARDVASSLGTKVTGKEEERVTKNYTESFEAYQLYLKGRYHLFTTRNQGAETGISYFHKAIEIDPNFALAYAGLAQAAIGLAFGSEMPPNEVFPSARGYAMRAVEIDPSLVEGHIAAGYITMWFDWDWSSAEGHLRQALELSPESADANLAYGILLCAMGRQKEGLVHMRRAVEIDPLNLRNNVIEAQFLNLSGQHDEALATLTKVLELEPNFYLAFPMLSAAYIEKGMYAEAVIEAQKARRMNPVASAPISLEAYALARSGRTSEARMLLETLISRAEKQYVSPQNIALIYAGLGENENSLEWLDRGVRSRDLRMTFLKIDPKWNSLRNEDGFDSIMRRLAFPE